MDISQNGYSSVEKTRKLRKIICDTEDIPNFVINECNPTFKAQNIENEPLFQTGMRVTVAAGQYLFSPIF